MSKCFVVLSMHRTATSLVAGGLQKMDVDMGRSLLGPRPSNPKGHFEDRDFILLNDDLLRDAGGSWHEPPSEEAILELALEYAPRIQKLIATRLVQAGGGQKLWGWKDPRTCLTVRVFAPYLPNPHYIVVYRDVSTIARSLQIRDGFELDKGRALALEYYERAERFVRDWREGRV